jgi:hypothetical protein
MISNKNEMRMALMKRRHQLGLNQKQLSEKSGITQSTISKMENHCKALDLDVIIKLMDALELKFDIKPVNKK